MPGPRSLGPDTARGGPHYALFRHSGLTQNNVIDLGSPAKMFLYRNSGYNSEKIPSCIIYVQAGNNTVTISNIGLFGKFNDSSVADAVAEVRDFLERNGLFVYLGNTTSSEIKGKRLDDQDISPDRLLDLAIVVGGDGTMLNVARRLSKYGIPAVGINLGRLGFLTDIPMTDVETNLEAILTGKYHIEQRTLLKYKIVKQGIKVASGTALNDIVLSKGNSGRLIEFEIRVNGQYVTRPRSDGIILSTPTGSTAYALSAGGPIIWPNLPVMSLAPICPHTLSNRPIILAENDKVQILVLELRGSPANLTLDGVLLHQLDSSESIYISKAKRKLKLIKIEGFNYFETLYSKLGWQG